MGADTKSAEGVPLRWRWPESHEEVPSSRDDFVRIVMEQYEVENIRFYVREDYMRRFAHTCATRHVERYAQQVGGAPPEPPEPVRGSQRAVQMRMLAGAVKQRGLTEDEVADCLRIFNRRCVPRFTDAEIRATASAFR